MYFFLVSIKTATITKVLEGWFGIKEAAANLGNDSGGAAAPWPGGTSVPQLAGMHIPYLLVFDVKRELRDTQKS